MNILNRQQHLIMSSRKRIKKVELVYSTSKTKYYEESI
jgi:hypothetical protein